MRHFSHETHISPRQDDRKSPVVKVSGNGRLRMDDVGYNAVSRESDGKKEIV
jgi:hypothetical protein